jgi:hypothetical protein
MFALASFLLMRGELCRWSPIRITLTIGVGVTNFNCDSLLVDETNKYVD